MRGKFLQGLIVCLAALGPFSALPGDLLLWRAWIEFATCNWMKWCRDGLRFTWPGEEMHRLFGFLFPW